jgi:hypothetical protein
MQIEYTPSEQDWIALAKFQVSLREIPHARMRRARLTYVLGFSLLALGTYLTLPSPIISILFLLMALIVFIMYPYFFRRRMESQIPEVVRRKATSQSYAIHTLRALPEGPELQTEHTQSRVDWAMVDAAQETESHLFISIDGLYSVAIPKQQIPPDDYEAFMVIVRNFCPAAAGPLTGVDQRI